MLITIDTFQVAYTLGEIATKCMKVSCLLLQSCSQARLLTVSMERILQMSSQAVSSARRLLLQRSDSADRSSHVEAQRLRGATDPQILTFARPLTNLAWLQICMQK